MKPGLLETTTMRRSKEELFESIFFECVWRHLPILLILTFVVELRNIDFRWSKKETVHYGLSTLKKNVFLLALTRLKTL